LLFFESGNLVAIESKILQLMGQQPTSQQMGSINNPQDILRSVIQILNEPSRYQSTSFTEQQIQLLLAMVTSWPPEAKFPGEK
jgi:hypothetical protein